MQHLVGGRLVAALGLAVALTGCTVGTVPRADTEPSPGAAKLYSSPLGATPPPTTATPPAQAAGDPAFEAPDVGDCRAIPAHGFGEYDDESPIADCDADHTAETFFVGDIADVDPDAAAADEADPTDIFSHTACEKQLDDYVGSADWGATRLFWIAFLPSAEQWTAGARWYRCDVYAPTLGTDGWRSGDTLTGALHNGWTPALFTKYQSCMNYNSDDTDDTDQVDCAGPHNAETVPGVLDLDNDVSEPYPGDDKITDESREQCTPLVVDYFGGSPDGISLLFITPDEDQWTRGMRNITCAFTIDGGDVSGTLRGHGSGAIPTTPISDGTQS